MTTQQAAESGHVVPFTFDERNVTSGENRTTVRPDGPCGTLHETAQAVGYTIHGSDDCAKTASETDVAQSLRTRAPGSTENSSTTVAASRGGVRRLTPKECCRLQGFPDDWLDGLGLSDSAKYRLLGNAVAVPVAEWLGRRLIGVTK